MKIAIPVWGNRMSPVVDTSSRLRVVEVAGNQERGRSETELQTQDLSRRCIRIRNLGVNVLICGAITGHLVRLLRASGVEVIPGISGDPDEVLTAYLDGTLASPRFLMPGCKALHHGQEHGTCDGQGPTQCRRKRRNTEGGANERR